MTKFQINIRKLNRNIDDYNKLSKKIAQDIDLSYNTLNNIDYVWKDNLTESFSSLVSKDKINVYKYFDYLNSYYNEISKFRNDISYCLSRCGCSSEASVKFNSKRMNLCLDYLSDVINNIEVALYYTTYFRTGGIEERIDYEGIGFSELSLVNQLKSYLSDIQRQLNVYSNNIKKMSKEFSSAVSNSQARRYNLLDFDGKFSQLSFNSSNKEFKDFDNVYIKNNNKNMNVYNLSNSTTKLENNTYNMNNNIATMKLSESDDRSKTTVYNNMYGNIDGMTLSSDVSNSPTFKHNNNSYNDIDAVSAPTLENTPKSEVSEHNRHSYDNIDAVSAPTLENTPKPEISKYDGYSYDNVGTTSAVTLENIPKSEMSKYDGYSYNNMGTISSSSTSSDVAINNHNDNSYNNINTVTAEDILSNL